MSLAYEILITILIIEGNAKQKKYEEYVNHKNNSFYCI